MSENNIDLKSMQVNTDKSKTKMTKRVVDIQTGYIGRVCLDALNTRCGCTGWATGCKTGWQRLFSLISGF